MPSTAAPATCSPYQGPSVLADTLREALSLDRPLTGTEEAVTVRILTLLREGRGVRSIAERLNEEGFPTEKGGRWYSSTVRIVLLRYAASPVRQEQIEKSRRATAHALAEMVRESATRQSAALTGREVP